MAKPFQPLKPKKVYEVTCKGMVRVLISGVALAVDGVTEINMAKAQAGGVTPGDTPGFPVTINQPGSYRLTGNLTLTEDATAILVEAEPVTVDLNGFTIECQAGAAGGGPCESGSAVDGNFKSNVTVKNGTVRGFGNGLFSAESPGIAHVGMCVLFTIFLLALSKKPLFKVAAMLCNPLLDAIDFN